MATIIIRNSTGSGAVPSSLVQGELAINTVDGKLFYGSGSGSIVKEFTASNSLTASYLNTLNQDLTFNGNLTLNGTASISTLVVNQTQYSSGSNQLGDAANDTQTLYGSVVIPTGSLTVTGSAIISSSAATQLQVGSNLLFVSGSGNVGIGTSTPDSYYAKKLVVSAVDESGITIAGTTTSATNYLAFADGTSGNQAYRGYVAYRHLTDQLAFGTGGTLRATIDNSGNFGVGTSTNTILARTHIQGSGTTSATTALRVENANTSASLIVRDDGNVLSGNIIALNGALAISSTGGGVAGNYIILNNGGFNFTNTSSNINHIRFLATFAPTSGTGTYVQTAIEPTINQTGGANGITRGLYINPTLTAAADFRAIETTAGKVIFAGTGNVLIGTTTDAGYRLDVSGSTRANSIFFGAGLPSVLSVDPTTALANSTTAGTSVRIGDNVGSTISGYQTYVASPGIVDRQYTSGEGGVMMLGSTLGFNRTFSPTSGTGVFNILRLSSIINQTGGANGITRGLFINPTLTAAADYRAIENIIGNNLLNSTSGNTYVGLSTNSGTARLQVRGSGATNATTSFLVQNSTPTTLFQIQDNGVVGINRTPTASLDVAGTTRLSGSFNTAASGSILTVIGSGSTQPIFTVQGSQGELFSITDSLTGSLFSVNDISGLPILEVFSDNTTLIGDYQDPMLITTKKVTMTNSGSFIVYSLPTASYDTAFFDYSIKSGSNGRAGQIMAIQSGSSVNFTETTTTDFGSTTAVSFTVLVSGSNMVLTGSAATGSWTIKTIVRGL